MSHLERARHMQLEFNQIVPAAIEDVFAFHRNPANLRRLLRAWPRFQLLQFDEPFRIGGRMWVQEMFFCIPVALGFRHTIFEPPARIGGEMFHGPFRTFVHTHSFAACTGGTRITDRLDVTAPACFGGDWTLRRFVAPLLRRAFKIRQAALLDLARSDRLHEWEPVRTAAAPAVVRSQLC